jgi:glycerate kinase
MVNILFASDSFKGSLTSNEINSLLKKVAEKELTNVQTRGVEVGDGGEGTLFAIKQALGCKLEKIEVFDPLFRRIKASYGIFVEDDNIKAAYIEMAQASSLTLLQDKERNPMQTSSYGTGELIAAAIKKGCKRIYIGLGGSATNDGGIGALSALGIQFFDKNQNLLEGKGSDLSKIYAIDYNCLHKDIQFTILTDVQNELLGEQGATNVFSRQKGADEAMVKALEKGMGNFSEIAEGILKKDFSTISGAGAAGGLGFALTAFLGGRLVSGIDTVLDIINYDKLLRTVDLVITGEGCLDYQSAFGKVVSGILKRNVKNNVPTIAIAGSLGKGADELYACGLTSMEALIASPMDLENAIKNAEKLYIQAATRVFRTLSIKQAT